MVEEKDKKYKILIVDDDNFMVDMYSIKFKERGFDVRAMLDSKRALDALRGGFDPDVVLFDIIMPGMSGLELLEAIKKEKLANRALLITLSNQWQESDMKRAKELGADDYIIKADLIPSEVLDKVERAIDNHNKNK